MKLPIYITFLVLFFNIHSNVLAQEKALEAYISNYDYTSRKEMKIDSKTLVQLFKQNKVQLIDIRFKEENQAWNMPWALSIPLPELPNNLHKLDSTKIIVTACPHKDRAIIAMVYLKMQGYDVKYLSDGLISLAENLRGDTANKFLKNL